MKSDLRKEARQRREILCAAATAEMAANIFRHFIEGPLTAWQGKKPPVIAGYWPFGSEADIKPLLHSLTELGHEIALPVTGAVGEALQFRTWSPGMDLLRDRMGMLAPPPIVPVTVPDIVIAPALAFDKSGHRLGYGKGFYDITLRQLRATRSIVAVVTAFAGQEVDTIYSGPQDEAMDWIVTEAYSLRVCSKTA